MFGFGVLAVVLGSTVACNCGRDNKVYVPNGTSDYSVALAKGQEIYWDYMPEIVAEGKISRNDAIESLRQGLVESIIPEYKKMGKTGDRAHWKQRYTEAKTALKEIQEGRKVRYRGVEL